MRSTSQVLCTCCESLLCLGSLFVMTCSTRCALPPSNIDLHLWNRRKKKYLKVFWKYWVSEGFEKLNISLACYFQNQHFLSPDSIMGSFPLPWSLSLSSFAAVLEKQSDFVVMVLEEGERAVLKTVTGFLCDLGWVTWSWVSLPVTEASNFSHLGKLCRKVIAYYMPEVTGQLLTWTSVCDTNNILCREAGNLNSFHILMKGYLMSQLLSSMHFWIKQC